jgi:signal transduction histidine kinase
MRERIGVRARVTALATLIVGLAVAASGVLLVRTVDHALERHVAEEGEHQLQVAQELLESGAPPSALNGQVGGSTLLQVFDSDGKEVSPGPQRSDLPFTTDITNLGAGGVTVSGRGPGRVVGSIREDDAGYVVRYTQVSVNGSELTVVTRSSLADVKRSVDTLKGYLEIGLPALIVLVALLAWFAVGRALRPVEAMRQEAEAISSSTIHRRVPEPARGDEVGRLARTLNQMLDRLEDGAQRQRQFVSDASHELRSPMAVIRTKVEVAQRKGATADWPKVGEAVLAEEARLEALVGDLLALAREDEGGARPEAVVDLAGVVSAEAALARRKPVATDLDDVSVPGDERALRSLVAHLLDNAARHARRRVHVSLAAVDGRAVLTVDDDGRGIAPEDRERVFERFVRLDESRARDRGGAGLGLAVVRSVARAHAGTATATASPTGGARLVVSLPLPARKSVRSSSAGGNGSGMPD